MLENWPRNHVLSYYTKTIQAFLSSEMSLFGQGPVVYLAKPRDGYVFHLLLTQEQCDLHWLISRIVPSRAPKTPCHIRNCFQDCHLGFIGTGASRDPPSLSRRSEEDACTGLEVSQC